MSHVGIELTVNGRHRRDVVDARLTLADYLRERLALTSVRLGCEQGVCGACTVLVDGRTARSCLLLAAQMDSRRIHTIEGLRDTPTGCALNEALSAHGGVQCGFCTAGVIVTATELLAGAQELDEEEIRAGLGGNLCRCTGYQGIVEALREVSGKGLGEALGEAGWGQVTTSDRAVTGPWTSGVGDDPRAEQAQEAIDRRAGTAARRAPLLVGLLLTLGGLGWILGGRHRARPRRRGTR